MCLARKFGARVMTYWYGVALHLPEVHDLATGLLAVRGDDILHGTRTMTMGR
jgi:hypothetical protein